MKFMAFERDGTRGLAVAEVGDEFRGRLVAQDGLSIEAALVRGPEGLRSLAAVLAEGDAIDLQSTTFLPPLRAPGKVFCIGLNYADHTAEAGMAQPAYPTVFSRFGSNLIGHEAVMLRPNVSEQLDFEGELVAVIGRGGRHIRKESALEHVVGYSIFNDGSVRDFQTRTPQWTLGKNFDATGAFGPYLVTSDAMPSGGAGLKLETRLNGKVMQRADTGDMIFDVATLVAHLSTVARLEAGDLIVTGTPAGVGAVRTPPLWMKPGDVCEVEIEGIGTLRNRIEQEPSGSHQ